MEKQRVYRKIGIKFGLLILFFSVLPAAAQQTTDIQTLRVTAQESSVYAGTECMLVLIIPETNPADVQTETPSTAPGVNFISMRRTVYVKDGVQNGTEIDLWFTFDKAQEYTLPPLKIKIRNRPYSIPFDSINVLQDPSTLQPVFVIRFDNGTEITGSQKSADPLFTVSTGDTVRFTVFVQYAANVMNLEWSVPKDALLTQTAAYDADGKNAQNGRGTSGRIPVARFEWQPLAPGLAPVPEIHCTASSYSGSRVPLSQPPAHITVIRSAKKTVQNSTRGEDYFAYAFTETHTAGSVGLHPAVSNTDCEKLAMLRSKERNALFQRQPAAERRAFEAKLGITDGFKEPGVPLFRLILAGTAAAVLCSLVLLLLKKRNGAGLFAGAACVLCIAAVLQGRQVTAEYGIFKGGIIHSVPDESSGIVSPADSGQRVRIEETAGKWIYIQYGSTGGWISSSSVIMIR